MSGGGAAAAYFDVDGTLARSNIVRFYVHFRTRGRGRLGRVLWIAGYLPQVARWLVLDAIDRQRMNRSFYRGYRGLDAAVLAAIAEHDHAAMLGRHVFAGARARVAEHRARGERVVLLTGSLDFIVAPLARDLGADEVLAARMTRRDGQLTGELETAPLAGAEKARRVRAHAGEHGIDLAASWAYGDSIADLPMLEAAGRPVAINPDRKLEAIARARGWPVERWR